MCRWLGYRGSPIGPHELLYDTERSLIKQSRRHTPNLPLPNGNGTGLGWYSRRRTAALCRSTAPAWGDQNLHELSNEVASPLFLAHVRAATGTPVQETNCRPFRWQTWLFVHNGYLDRFATVHRELLKMTLGLTDGQPHYAVRNASGPAVNTLFVSADVEAVRMLYPEQERLRHFCEDARVVVSEPLDELPGPWRELPPSTALTVTDTVDAQDFVPVPLDVQRDVAETFAARADAPALHLIAEHGARFEVRSGGPEVRVAATGLLGWLTGRSTGADLACATTLPELPNWA